MASKVNQNITQIIQIRESSKKNEFLAPSTFNENGKRTKEQHQSSSYKKQRKDEIQNEQVSQLAFMDQLKEQQNSFDTLQTYGIQEKTLKQPQESFKAQLQQVQNSKHQISLITPCTNDRIKINQLLPNNFETGGQTKAKGVIVNDQLSKTENNQKIIYLKGTRLFPDQEVELEKINGFINICYEHINSLHPENRLQELAKNYIQQLPLILERYYHQKYENINQFLEFYKQKYQPLILHKLEQNQLEAIQLFEKFERDQQQIQEQIDISIQYICDIIKLNKELICNDSQTLIETLKGFINNLEMFESVQLQLENQLQKVHISTSCNSILQKKQDKDFYSKRLRVNELELQKQRLIIKQLECLQNIVYENQYLNEDQTRDETFELVCNTDPLFFILKSQMQ